MGTRFDRKDIRAAFRSFRLQDFLSLCSDQRRKRFLLSLRSRRDRFTAVMPFPDGLAAADVADGQVRTYRFLPWTSPVTEESAADTFRRLSDEGFPPRELVLLINGADLRFRVRRFPGMDEKDLKETIDWESDRIFSLPGAAALAGELLRADPGGCDLLLAGILRDTLHFWEKSARRGGKHIVRAVPAPTLPAGDRPFLALCLFRKKGVLLFRCGDTCRLRNVFPDGHGKGLYFVKSTAKSLGVHAADFFLFPMGDCGAGNRAAWRDWAEAEFFGGTGREMISPEEMAAAGEEESFDPFYEEEGFSENSDSPAVSGSDTEEGMADEEEEPADEILRWELTLHRNETEGASDEDRLREETEPMMQAAGENRLSFPLTAAGQPFLTGQNAGLRFAQGMALLSLLALGAGLIRYETAAVRYGEAEQEAAALAPYRAELHRREAAEREERKLEDRLKALEAANPHWENRLLLLPDLIPDGVVLSALTDRDGEIRIRGTASSSEPAEKFRAALEKNWGGKARLTDRTVQKNMISFTVVCEEAPGKENGKEGHEHEKEK